MASGRCTAFGSRAALGFQQTRVGGIKQAAPVTPVVPLPRRGVKRALPATPVEPPLRPASAQPVSAVPGTPE
eukprot:6018602-Amphidinium_carterae.2